MGRNQRHLLAKSLTSLAAEPVTAKLTLIEYQRLYITAAI